MVCLSLIHIYTHMLVCFITAELNTPCILMSAPETSAVIIPHIKNKPPHSVLHSHETAAVSDHSFHTVSIPDMRRFIQFVFIPFSCLKSDFSSETRQPFMQLIPIEWKT